MQRAGATRGHSSDTVLFDSKEGHQRAHWWSTAGGPLQRQGLGLAEAAACGGTSGGAGRAFAAKPPLSIAASSSSLGQVGMG